MTYLDTKQATKRHGMGTCGGLENQPKSGTKTEAKHAEA
ncbi:hypothetical protein SLEP1_g35484 [Rubroshorea leprosula]|uniref:Uncharacterized protein n=1 Tax=Rubroshorea leprosula TaxID=152421 RepID=A0AAV5KNG9_9ROSI|nr:hypothetical protein SLEP1_g35484 [Rubroshorea leprosula]